MIKALLIISTASIIGLTGCATTATITDPQGNVYTYKGPKGIDMSVKKAIQKPNIVVRLSPGGMDFWAL